MRIRFFPDEFSVCKIRDATDASFFTTLITTDLYFLAKTPGEYSLVCPTAKLPGNVIKAEHGWRVFRIEGELAFSLVGILARLARVLAERQISIFAVSTFDTDYILLKKEHASAAAAALLADGFEVV